MPGKRGKGIVFGGFKIPVGTNDKYPKATVQAILTLLKQNRASQVKSRDVGTTESQRKAIDKKIADLDEAIAYYTKMERESPG